MAKSLPEIFMINTQNEWWGVMRKERFIISFKAFLCLAMPYLLSACAVYAKDDAAQYDNEVRDVPSVAVLSPEEYNEAMKGYGEFFNPSKGKFNSYRVDHNAGNMTPAYIFRDEISEYRNGEGRINCNSDFSQASVDDADYILVARVYNEAKLSGLSFFVTGITLTLVPAVYNGVSTLSYEVYSTSNQSDLLDKGAVSVDYVSLEHAFSFGHSWDEAQPAGDKMFCSLLVKSLLDAKRNYTFYE